MDLVSSDVVEFAEPVEGVQLALLAAGERMSVQRFRIEPGATVPEHSHPHEQVGYLVSGDLTFLIEGEEIVVEDGDSYSLASEEPHGVENRSERVVEGIDVFSPPRTNPDWAED